MFNRQAIITEVPNPFNYADFIIRCKTNNIEQLSLTEWASKVQIYFEAQSIFPNLTPLEAYKSLIYRINSFTGAEIASHDTVDTTSSCGGCGGGVVR